MDETTHEPILSILSLIVETAIKLRRDGHRVVIVSSGAVGVGLQRMNIPKRPKHLAQIQVSHTKIFFRFPLYFPSFFPCLRPFSLVGSGWIGDEAQSIHPYEFELFFCLLFLFADLEPTFRPSQQSDNLA